MDVCPLHLPFVIIDGPTKVDINLMFRGISDISDNKMQFSVIVTFREEWLDDRLKFENMQGNINPLLIFHFVCVARPTI
ncbi:putative Glutamate-gated chloride channel [Daphnia magna]|uniref:Putative Glutamate-gated chloride channel n=1 Tax=Daphnia magna TaxID=35525 RepID=A0A164GTK0_9CRUS|nr:putative Glutamate-gated chloride channel [Daphnia magna]